MSFLGAKVLGSYELELQDAIQEILANPPPQVVDVGAGEGYYVVGLARRTPHQTRVVAFESDRISRRHCREMAELNGVAGKISIRGKCDPSTLNETLAAGALLVCDCEGYEVELLRPDVVPQLRSATILVELHRFIDRSLETTVQDRFVTTHQISTIEMQPRSARHWAELSGWDEDAAFFVLSEGARAPDRVSEVERVWAYMVPHPRRQPQPE